MSKEKYKRNKKRVFEITGTSPREGFNIHHIIQRRDYKEDRKRWDASVPSGRFDVDDISNLFPVTVEDHEWINRKINPEPVKKKRKRKRRRR